MRNIYEDYLIFLNPCGGGRIGLALKKTIAVFLLSIFTQTIFSQVTVVQNSNSQTLAQLLAGTGVTISNYTMSCNANGSGTFTNVSSNLGMAGGVVLASGRVQNIPQVATAFASTQFTLSGDAQLSTLTSGVIRDPCVLEFDIVPQGPLLRFNYVFASEEYPEWVCSQYNDVFGFFISGPKPGGGTYTSQNIAIIPSTTLPVAINTINPGTPGANAGGGTCSGANQSLAYTAYYRNNLIPTVNPNIVYDGMTTVMQAIIAVTPCQTYHLKLAIADVADRIYDSGVFLDAYSFTSNPVSVSALGALDYAGFSSAYEGCVGGSFTFTLSQVQATDVYVNLSVTGTATNGTDYTPIPLVIMIPAGQTSVVVNCDPLVDAFTEGAETVTVGCLDPCTGIVTSQATLTIRDDIPPTITVSDSTLCLGQSAALNASSGVTYTWSPTTGLSNPNVKNPIATPTVTTTYTVTMTFGSCIKTKSQTIYVSNPSNAVTAVPTGTICNGATVNLTSNPSGGVSPYTYMWSTGSTSNNITVASSGTYAVTATDNYGCSASANRTVTISNLSVSGVVTNVSCMGGNNGVVDITVTGSNAPFTYLWNGGGTAQDVTTASAGTYSVTVTNTVGCTVSASYTVTQPSSNLTTSATNNSVSCNGGNNGSINLTPAGGVSPYTFLWSNGATTEDVSSLTAATYTVTVTDNNGCTASRSVVISQPTAITTSETHVNNTCNAGAIGSIDLTVAGGVGVFTYAWSNGANTQDISSLTAATYTVTVSDGNGCTATRSVVITQPTAISITLTPSNVSCNGGNNGAITNTSSGGTGALTYNWGGGITTQNRASLTAGNYSVTVTDANSCTASASVAITQPAVLTVSTTQINILCNGGSTGSVNTTVAGGTSPYTYLWNGGATTANRTSLAAGTYNVTVTDNRGCTATASATITQPAALALSNTTTNVSCNGGNNGSIDLTVSGGTTAYTYNWGGGITTQDRTNLTAATYNVTVTDANACTASMSATITQPVALTVSFTSVNPTCNGAATGSINSTPAGGTSPYTYLWNDGNTSQNRTLLVAGTYNVTITDNKGCTVAGTRTLTQPTAITITPTVTNASCAVGNDGAISLAVAGGTSPYTYLWNGGQTTQNRTILTAGTYTVTVTDNVGCTTSLPIAVTQIGSGITLSTAPTNILCFGGNTGAIDVTASTATPPLSYNWGGGITTEDRINLVAGTYTVTVTDGAGCSAVASNTLTQPGAAISLTTTSTNVLCFGSNTGAITLNVSGGTSPYTYDWGGGITTQNRSALAAGTYNVTVTDNNLCTASTSATVTQPAVALSGSTTVTNVSCNAGANGAVNLTVSGGTSAFTFVWNNGSISEDLSGVISGTYNVTITDANSCTATATATVTQPAAALSVSFTPTNILCNGASTGAINTTVTGGTAAYSYLWNDANTSANRTLLAAGNYSVTVTDANTCTASANTTLTQPAAISVTLTPTSVSCNGGNNGAINTSASGGTGVLSYNWGGGITTQNRTGLTAGSYTVTVTDANACTATATTTVTQPTVLTLNVTNTASVCQNATGSATASTSGSGTSPYNYVWSNAGPNAPTQSSLAPGSYSVTVTDANACTVSGSTTVGVSNNNTNASFTISGTYCAPTDVVTFTHTGSSGNTSQFWDFGNGSGSSTIPSPSYTYLSAGTYTVHHIVYKGFCADSVTQNVTIRTTPVITPTVVNATCNASNNGSITLVISSGTPAYTFNWGGGITTQNRTSLSPGTYTVTVTDAGPCSATFTTNITQPTAFTLTNTTTIVSCFGGSNGAIDLTVSGATPAYTYLWSNSATTQDISSVAGGNYTVTVTDANACTATSTINIFEPAAISLSTSVTAALCNGQNNGAITLMVSGGTSPYTYNWGGGITTQNRTSLVAGTYNVTVTDNKGCTATTSATVTQPNVLSTSLVNTNVSCMGGVNGTITTTTTGGTSPFTYVWNDANTDENRNGLSAGTYNVTSTDINGCTATASITLTQPATEVNVMVNSTSTIACYGQNTGTINITASGGTPAYTYLWGDSSTLQNRTGMLGGTYFVTVSDNNNCSATTSATIAQPASPLSIDTLVAVDVLCFGNSTGSLTTTVSGGTSPYTYNWGGGITTPNRINIPAGTYNITVTDNNACTASASAVIAQPAAAVSVSVASTTNVSCNGGNNGTINITPAGGTSPYTFNWGGGVTTQNRTGLTAGIYNVTVTDSVACTASVSATVTQPATLTVSVSSTTNVSCFGGNNGAINIAASGGTTAYSYNWGGGITTQNRTGLTAGTYNVTVTDANACTASTSANITEPSAALSVSVSSTTNVSCFGGNNGAINISATGGTTAYSYNWGGGITTQNRTGLTAGTYNVTVTDANACTASTSANITEPSAALSVSVSSTTNVSCFGGNNGAINISASGGTTAYSYNWGGGITTQNRTGLTAGTYNVTVTDASTCTASTSASITEPAAALSVSVSSTTNVLCFGGNNGAINISASGGTTAYSYNWGGGITTQNRTGLTAGTYNVTVTDANACTASTSANITEPSAALSVSVSSTTNVLCFGGNNGAINIAASGGTTAYSYNWGGGITTQNRTGLTAGTYNVTVTDANLCTASTSANITQPASAVSATISSTTPVSCFGGNNGSTTVTGNGGTPAYTYNWVGGITTTALSNLSAGSYNVTVTDANACTATTTATITQPATAVSATISATTNVSCFGGNDGSATATGNGGTPGYTYNWVGGTTTATKTNLTAGTYNVTVTDANSCSATTSATITEPTAVSVSTTHVDVNCFGGNDGSINTTPAGGTPGYTYNWGGGITTQNRTGLTIGNYTITVSDANACTAVTTVAIAQPTAISVSSTVGQVSCNSGTNGTISLTVSGGVPAYTFVWSNSGTTQNINTLSAGSYSVTISDSHLCTATTSATVTEPTTIVLSTTVTNVSCFNGNNGAINLTVNGGTPGYTYNWGGGITTQNRTSLTANTYSVTVSDNNACTISTSATVTEPTAIAASSTVTQVNCFGNNTGAIDVTVSGGTSPYSYLWNDAVTSEDRTGIASGNYSVTITDANSCTAVHAATITEPAAVLNISATPVAVSCFGGNNGAINSFVSGGTSPYSFVWNDAATSLNRTNLTSGTYSVTVTDNNACTSSTSATVNQPVAALSVSVASTTNVLCFGGNNGAINITVSGGTTAYTYDWGGGITTQNRTNLIAGTYNVTVTDANSCTATQSAIITEPASGLSVAVSSTTNVLCFGGNNGAIDITANGGTTAYTYLWNDAVTTEDRTNLTAGNYAVTVTDANACTVSTSSVITQPAAALSATVSSTTNVSCFGGNNGAISISVSGGTTAYSYLWNDAITSQNRTGLVAGNYSVTVTDANACTASTSSVITEPAAALSVAVASTTNVLCFGGNNGAINISVSGGTTAYTYDWGGGITTQNRTNLIAGTYNVTVTDANSCTATQSAIIIEPASGLTATVSSTTNVLCFAGNNGAIDITANGGTTAYTYLWNDAVTTEDRTNLTAGNYSVTVTDANACTVSTSSTISQPTQISVSHTSTNVLCNGGNTGTISLNVSGGVAAYTFLWNSGATTQNIANASAGAYDVTITDNNACTVSYVGNISITEPALLTVTATAVDALCFGSSTGSVNATVNGGTTAYTYLWSNGAVSQNISSVTTNTYDITVTDANACSASANAIVNEPTQLTLSTTQGDVSCNNGNNGSIDLTVSGATSPYTYLWSNSATTQDISNLTANTYSVVVNDNNNCSASIAATITQPTQLTASTTTTAVLCNGGNTGAINLTVNGGVTAYSFVWSNAAVTQNINNLIGGNYSVTITDANACSISTSANVTEPAALTVSTVVTDVLCNGGNNGAITTTVTGGITNYTYDWGGGVTTQNRTNIIAGTYTLNVTDANNCAASSTATVSEPTAIALSETHTNVSCFGGSNAGIDLTANGGTSPYTYLWSNSATTQDISNIAVGNYSVNVTDNHNCTATLSVVISEPTLLTVSSTKVDVLCNGAATGSISLNVNGATTPYTFAWSNSATTQNITNITAGNYIATVSDANSCSATITNTINEPTAISIAETHNDVFCNGNATGAIDITTTGGVANYTFNWSNSTTVEDQSGVVAGTYTVTVTDANACTMSRSVTISEPTALSITLQYNNATCNGSYDGNINITVSGATPGYTFNWNNGATTEDLNNIPAGNYMVNVSDANNCIGNANITITQPMTIAVVTNTHTDVSCNGGSNGAIDISIVGGTWPFTYTWNDGATTQDRTNLSAGTYQITVNDINACAVSQPIYIVEPTALQVTATPSNVSCNGGTNGSIIVVVVGGSPNYNYLWSNGGTLQNATNIAAGNYSVTVTDANSCTATQSETVAEPTAVSINSTKTDVLCFGGNTGAIDVTTTGGTSGYNFLWSNGGISEDAAQLSQGSYSLNVTDANNCTASMSWTVTEPAQIALSMIKTDPLCNGVNNGTIDLTVTGGTGNYSYVWNGNSSLNMQDPQSVGGGMWSVVVTDANNCTATQQISVTMPSQILLNELHSDPTCNGFSNGRAEVFANGGTPPYTFQWNNGPVTRINNNIPAGNYSVIVTDANNCQMTLNSILLGEPALLGIGVQVTNVACVGGMNGQANVTVNGGTPNYSFHWNNNYSGEDLVNVVAGTYTLTVTDTKGCTQTASAFINTLPQLDATAIVEQLICVQDFGGIDLTVNSGTAPYTFQWSNGATTEDLNNINPGVYTVTVQDANGCPFDTSFVIVNTNSFNVTASGGGTVTLGQTVDIHAISTGSNQTTYNWAPTFGVPCITCADNTVQPGHYTLYTVIATDTNGCIAQDTVSVDVIADHTIFTPNAFTPNGDGNNDVLQLFGNLAGIKKFDLMVFDRWGEKVYDSNDQYFQWDGTYKGESLPPSVYVYVMKVVMLDGYNAKVFKGSITLLR